MNDCTDVYSHLEKGKGSKIGNQCALLKKVSEHKFLSINMKQSKCSKNLFCRNFLKLEYNAYNVCNKFSSYCTATPIVLDLRTQFDSKVVVMYSNRDNQSNTVLKILIIQIVMLRKHRNLKVT